MPQFSSKVVEPAEATIVNDLPKKDAILLLHSIQAIPENNTNVTTVKFISEMSDIKFAVGRESGKINLWFLSSQSKGAPTQYASLNGHIPDTIRPLCVWNDGKHIVTVGNGTCCRYWEKSNDERESYQLKSLIPVNTVQKLAFRKILYISNRLYTLQTTRTGRGDSILVCWKFNKVKQLFEIVDSVFVCQGLATDMIFCKAKNLIAISSARGSVFTFNANSILKVSELKKLHLLPITSICNLAGSNVLVSTSMDGTIRISKLKTFHLFSHISKYVLYILLLFTTFLISYFLTRSSSQNLLLDGLATESSITLNSTLPKDTTPSVIGSDISIVQNTLEQPIMKVCSSTSLWFTEEFTDMCFSHESGYDEHSPKKTTSVNKTLNKQDPNNLLNKIQTASSLVDNVKVLSTELTDQGVMNGNTTELQLQSNLSVEQSKELKDGDSVAFHYKAPVVNTSNSISNNTSLVQDNISMLVEPAEAKETKNIHPEQSLQTTNIYVENPEAAKNSTVKQEEVSVEKLANKSDIKSKAAKESYQQKIEFERNRFHKRKKWKRGNT